MNDHGLRHKDWELFLLYQTRKKQCIFGAEKAWREKWLCGANGRLTDSEAGGIQYRMRPSSGRTRKC